MFASSKKRQNPLYPWGFYVLDKWLQIKSRGDSLVTYFDDNSIKRIAIYGLGVLGKRLYEELQQEKVKIVCGIDQNAKNIQIDNLEIRTLEDEFPQVDAVVVTPVAFREIEKEIYQKAGWRTEVVSIEDVVDYCFLREDYEETDGISESSHIDMVLH